MRNLIVWFVILFSAVNGLAQSFTLRATLMEEDSFSKVPFAVVSLKGKMIATVSDESGYFELPCKSNDTLLISHVSHGKIYIPVKKVADTSGKRVKIYLHKKEVELIQATISGKRLSKEKKEEYQRHLDRVRPTISSPISAIYESLSRRGKERSKMDEIYSELLLRDALEIRLPPRKLYLITGDKSVKLDDLLMLCPVNEYFVKNASDYTFFYHFSRCWELYQKNIKR